VLKSVEISANWFRLRYGQSNVLTADFGHFAGPKNRKRDQFCNYRGARTARTVPLDNSRSYIPTPSSVRVKVRSGVSTVRVRVGSLGLVGLLLGLELGLGLWFELGGCP